MYFNIVSSLLESNRFVAKGKQSKSETSIEFRCTYYKGTENPSLSKFHILVWLLHFSLSAYGDQLRKSPFLEPKVSAVLSSELNDWIHRREPYNISDTSAGKKPLNTYITKKEMEMSGWCIMDIDSLTVDKLLNNQISFWWILCSHCVTAH